MNKIADILGARFVETITTDQDPVSQCCSVLKARGFLLEDESELQYETEHIYLSDNSHANDSLYLDKLLRETDIGHIFSDDTSSLHGRYQKGYVPVPLKRWEVIITGTITEDKLLHIFSQHTRGETGNIADWSKCAGREVFESLKIRNHGTKVEVDFLDSYISRLVKTLNAIGITTTYSCDGNYKDNTRNQGDTFAFVQLRCVYDSAWLSLILERFIPSYMDLANKWEISELPNIVNVLKIGSNEKDPLNLYCEIQQVADILYRNRIGLRICKGDFFKNLPFQEYPMGINGINVMKADFLRVMNTHYEKII